MITWLPHMVPRRLWNILLHVYSCHCLKYAPFGPKSDAWGGGRMAWVAILYSPPHIRELFFLPHYMTSGLFSWCQLFLLMQHIFLIFCSHPEMATCCCSALKSSSVAHLCTRRRSTSDKIRGRTECCRDLKKYQSWSPLGLLKQIEFRYFLISKIIK